MRLGLVTFVPVLAMVACGAGSGAGHAPGEAGPSGGDEEAVGEDEELAGADAEDATSGEVGEEGPETSEDPGPTVQHDPKSWNQTYGTPGRREHAFHAVPVADGGYVAVGSAEPLTGSGQRDAWVLRLDPAGAVVWRVAVGAGDVDDSLGAVRVSPDGGFVATGTTGEAGWLVRLDSGGGTLWEKTYADRGFGGFNAIVPAGDGGWILGGNPPYGYTTTAHAMKVDGDGNVVWILKDWTYEDPFGLAVAPTADGGCAVAGRITKPGEKYEDARLVKVDPKGKVVWDKVFGGDSSDEFRDVRVLPDGGVLVAGESASTGEMGWGGWLLRLDAGGKTIWEKRLDWPGQDRVFAVVPRADGYLLAGVKEVNPNFLLRGEAIWIAATDPGGSILWEKRLGTGSQSRPMSMEPTPDGGAILAAETEYGGESGDTAPWILKLDADGVACTPGQGAAALIGCKDGGVWAFDECEVPLQQVAECPEGQACVGGACSDCGGSFIACMDGDVYRFDSCGRKGEKEKTCGGPCWINECVAAGCALLDCSAGGFVYTCSTPSASTDFAYGGSGPGGLSSSTTHYANGRTVTCTFFGGSSGTCNDGTGAACTF